MFLHWLELLELRKQFCFGLMLFLQVFVIFPIFFLSYCLPTFLNTQFGVLSGTISLLLLIAVLASLASFCPLIVFLGLFGGVWLYVGPFESRCLLQVFPYRVIQLLNPSFQALLYHLGWCEIPCITKMQFVSMHLAMSLHLYFQSDWMPPPLLSDSYTSCSSSMPAFGAQTGVMAESSISESEPYLGRLATFSQFFQCFHNENQHIKAVQFPHTYRNTKRVQSDTTNKPLLTLPPLQPLLQIFGKSTVDRLHILSLCSSLLLSAVFIFTSAL